MYFICLLSTLKCNIQVEATKQFSKQQKISTNADDCQVRKILRQDSERSVGMLFLFKKIVNFSFDTKFGRFSKLSPIPSTHYTIPEALSFTKN